MLVDNDPPAQYFIAIAQVKVNNIAKGVFVVFGIPSPSCKPSALYSNITSAIKCYLE